MQSAVQIASLTEEQLARGIATASSGNHALAVVYACQSQRDAGRRAHCASRRVRPVRSGDNLQAGALRSQG